jgi:hypothetical protein
MKVGKAIYNILSQSKDVQSNFPFNTTDYSPTGTELVTNGDFSATGSNLVTNPNFTDTGSEVAVNGDFATDSDWGSNNTISGGQLTKTGTGLSFQEYAGFSVAKSYKCVIDVAEENGSNFTLYVGGSQFSLDVGVNTLYIVNGTTNNYLGFNDGLGSIVNSISVKELGEDWVSVVGADDTNTFGENGLTMTSTVGLDVKIYQANVISNSKSYKVTYTIHENGLTGTNAIQYYTGSALNGYDDLPDLSVGTHTFYYTAPSVANDRWYFKLDLRGGSTSTTDFVTISSLIVQELGEDWYLFSNTEPIFNASGVTLNTSNGFEQTINQRNVITSGTSYKVTYQITSATYTTGSQLDYYDGDSYVIFPEQGVGTHTFYYTAENPALHSWYMKLRQGSGTDEVTLSSISIEEMVLNKIFPELAPPDIDAPYVVYSVVSNSPSDTKNANGDIDTASIEVYGFQDTYNKAVDLGVSVRAALDRKTGTYNTIEIQSTNYVNEQMDVNEARKLWAAIQDYSIRIKNL